MMRPIARLLALVLLVAGGTSVGAQQQQRRVVTGRVEAASGGQPLSNAGVQLVGTRQGVFTDASGNFKIPVPVGAAVKLRVTLIGYKTQELDVAATADRVTAKLGQDVLNIDEIVVTGQATTVAKRNLANAVGTVSARELTRAPAPTLERAVAGKMAGVTIQQNSGAPGGGLQVNLRGVHSINASADPLFVVDGVIVSNAAIESMQQIITKSSSNATRAGPQDNSVNRIADLNPNDIERIEVLKGASASAIYGSKATNGVVIITTKRGAVGKPRIAFSEKLGQYRVAKSLGSRTFASVADAVATFGPSAANYFTPGVIYDHEKELDGNHDLSYLTSGSISGGDENTRYFISGLTQQDKGVVKNTGYQKQSARLNLDQKISDKVTAGLNMNVVHSWNSRGVTNNDNTGTSYWYVFNFTPSFLDIRATCADGTKQAFCPNNDGVYAFNPFVQSNPLQTAALLQNNERVWRMITSGKVDVQLMRGERNDLKIVGNGGVDFFSQMEDWYSPPELQFEPLDGLSGTAIRLGTNNYQVNGTSTVVDVFKPSGKSFLNQATTSAGLQYEIKDRLSSGVIARGLIGSQTGVDQGTPEVRERRERQVDTGFYGQEEMLLGNERLLLTAGFRADRSSNAGDPNKLFWYPKTSASYRLTRPIKQVDELKFRLAYGESGNQPLFSQKYTKLVANKQAGGVPGLQIDINAGDPTLRPERDKELEAGIDANFFGGRATLEVTGYRQVITDLLLQRGLAPSSGFSTLFFNAGELLTWGGEASLGMTPIQKPNLSWLFRTTFTASRNKVQHLPIPAFLTGGFGVAYGTWRIEEGQPITQMVATVALPLQAGLKGCQGTTCVVGSSNPDFRIQFTNDITIAKRINLYFLFDWQHGSTIANVTKANYDLAANARDYDARGKAAWAQFGTDQRNWIDPASFLKLREATLSYDVPKEAIQKIWGNFSSARVSVIGRDLHTWSRYWGMDPEVSNFGSQQFARNVDHSPYPPSHSYWFGVDLNF